MRKRSQESGYTIIVIAALFVAFMAVAAALLEGDVVNEQINRQQRAADQLHALAKALIQYSLDHDGRYPCPAKHNVAYTNSLFGAAVSNCATNAVLGIISGLDSLPNATPASDKTVRGIVPVLSLAAYGLTIDDAFDPWGNRVMYIVDKNLTDDTTTPASGTKCDPLSSTCVTLTDRVTTQPYLQPDFLLISYGQDHVGAIVKSQTGTMTPTITCISDGNNRTKNCLAHTVTFVRGAPYTNTNASAGTYFDDIVTAYAAGQDCAAAQVQWTVSAVSCSVTPTFTLPNGATYSFVNTAALKVGTITVSCNGGKYVQSDASCHSSAGIFNCTWVDYYDIWPNTTVCSGIPGYVPQPICDTSGTTTPGTTMTYSTATGDYANATCSKGPTCTADATNNTASAEMRQCRP